MSNLCRKAISGTNFFAELQRQKREPKFTKKGDEEFLHFKIRGRDQRDQINEDIDKAITQIMGYDPNQLTGLENEYICRVGSDVTAGISIRPSTSPELAAKAVEICEILASKCLGWSVEKDLTKQEKPAGGDFRGTVSASRNTLRGRLQ